MCDDAYCPLVQVGEEAPPFKGQAVVGSSFAKLSFKEGKLEIGDDKIKDKWVLLFFYPLDFTFVCPTEIIAFSDRLDEFEKVNTKVVACSVDSHFTHLAWKNTPRKQGGLGEIRYPILSDLSRQISHDYGVLLDGGMAARGIFLIDPKGVLQTYTVNNLAVGRSVDEALRLIQAYQYVAEHGEACPANWKPGEKSMKPDPEGSKEYFSQVK